MKKVIYTAGYAPSSLEEVKADVRREFGHLTLLDQANHIKQITARYLNK